MENYLAGRCDWTNNCIDTINFLDHVLRERPSQRYTQIKKSFFERGVARTPLGGGVEAVKGVFASLRPVLNDRYQKGLAINVDVANGTFWKDGPLLNCVMAILNARNLNDVKDQFKRSRQHDRGHGFAKSLVHLRRVGVKTTHRKQDDTAWTIDDFTLTDCRETTFPDPGDKREGIQDKNRRRISIQQYYKDNYDMTLQTDLPLARMTKKIRGGAVYIPLECLKIDGNQRYNAKLSDVQTSAMIKFAVTLPDVRRQAIENGVRLLDWGNDHNLKHYGIKVNPTPIRAKGRVLPPPQLTFGPPHKPARVEERDLVQGRWRLDGKKFHLPNREITGWAVFVVENKRLQPNKDQTTLFIDQFIKIFEGHGGKINNHQSMGKRPHVSLHNANTAGDWIGPAVKGAERSFGDSPVNFMIFVVPDKNVATYRRIKKSADCRFGAASQVLQARHVLTNQAQYISNVCLKVNAKLGGASTLR